MKKAYVLNLFIYITAVVFSVYGNAFDVSAETLVSLSNEILVISGGGDFNITGGNSSVPAAPFIISDNLNYNIIISDVYIDGKSTSSNGIFISSGANVNLIIKGENTVKGGDGFSGIGIDGDAKLNVSGDGVLNTFGGSSGAGIGGIMDNIGTITIDSGTINAYGGEYAAGIGGNKSSSGNIICVNGGKVSANGGNGGAGIGGGYGCKGGIISIKGGTVKCIGGGKAYDIGPGEGYSKLAGSVSIESASVYAKSVFFSATDTVKYMYTLNVSYNSCCIGNISFDNGLSYDLSDVYTDDCGNIYFWSSENLIDKLASVTIYGVIYSGKVSSEYSAVLTVKQEKSEEDIVSDIIKTKEYILCVADEVDDCDALKVVMLKQELLQKSVQ